MTARGNIGFSGKRALSGALLSLWAFCLSGVVNATGIDLGDLSPGDSVGFSNSQSTFLLDIEKDRYQFGLTSDGSDVSVDEFAFMNGGGIVYLSGKVGGETGWSGTSFTVNDLDAGDYSLVVRSKALGFGEFGYDGTLSVAAVPLPAAALLFGTALAGLVFRGRCQTSTKNLS
jgi:hypothetical protein